MENNAKQQKILVIGGGTGTFTVLSGLKKYPVSLSAIVTMADDGGSNKVIRDEFGLLPVSDIRQCFVALAEENGEVSQLMRKLFMYRFHQGNGISGMTFGNLFMAALTEILGSQKEAIEKTGKILRIKGQVIPVSFEDTRLAALYECGHTVIGEHQIDEPKHDGKLQIKELFLQPNVKANPDAVSAILNADIIVLGPGDLYTSTIPNLLVEGISDALKQTKAKIMYVMNLMTKDGQTYGFSAKKHIEAIEKYMKKSPDAVLMNSKPISQDILQRYIEMNSYPVADDLNNSPFEVIRADLLSDETVKKVAGDPLLRSLIRHDADKLAKNILFSSLVCRPLLLQQENRPGSGH